MARSRRGDLIVQYGVDSGPADSAYPIGVEFFRSSPGGEGKKLLFRDAFEEADFSAGSKTLTLVPAALGVFVGDALAATATDAAGNTSEFSATTALSVPIVDSASSSVPADPGGSESTGNEDSIEASVTIDADDLAGDTEITIDAISSDHLSVPDSGTTILSRVFTFGPPGIQFATPISIEVTYDDSEVAGLDENDIIPLLLLDESWVEVGDRRGFDPLEPDPCMESHDTTNNVIVIKTTHFSTYGISSSALPLPSVPGTSAAGLIMLALAIAMLTWLRRSRMFIH